MSVLGRVLTAIVTPFTDDGSVDFDAFQRARPPPRRERLRRARRRRHDRREPDARPTTSGSTCSAPRSRRSARRATVVAGTGTYSTAHSVHLTEEAHELGVDAFLVVTPYYNKPPQRGIVAHFKAVARASDRPIVVYNIPARVVVNIEPETIARLAEIENVRAVKQANDDLDAGAAHRRRPASTSTPATTTSSSRSSSSAAIGGVCVHTHVVGPQVAEQVRAAHAGDVERAREIDARARARPTTCSRWRRTRSRSRPRSTCSATTSAATACRSSPPTRRTRSTQVRGCLERLGLLVHA